MGLWEQMQSVLHAAFSALRDLNSGEPVEWQTWLIEAWRTEQRLSTQLRHTASQIPYEHYRKYLETMAQEDARHADLLRERLEVGGDVTPQPQGTNGIWKGGDTGGVYKALQRILAAKRELYESYHHQATMLDDPGLQALLRHLQQDQARHQGQLIELLMGLDAHVHERMT